MEFLKVSNLFLDSFTYFMLVEGLFQFEQMESIEFSEIVQFSMDWGRFSPHCFSRQGIKLMWFVFRL